MSTDAFFSLPRTTRPVDWFETILPKLGLRLPQQTLEIAMAYHVIGAGGGTWTVLLQNGRPVTQKGVAGNVVAHLSMSAGHFREAIAGALRERLGSALQRLGKAKELPDMSRQIIDAKRLAAVAAIAGSVAIVLHDKHFGDTYRYVLTMGGNSPDYDKAQATIEVDLDDLLALAVARTPPLQMLVSGKLKLHGDTGLPQRWLLALLGK